MESSTINYNLGCLKFLTYHSILHYRVISSSLNQEFILCSEDSVCKWIHLIFVALSPKEKHSMIAEKPPPPPPVSDSCCNRFGISAKVIVSPTSFQPNVVSPFPCWAKFRWRRGWGNFSPHDFADFPLSRLSNQEDWNKKKKKKKQRSTVIS